MVAAPKIIAISPTDNMPDATELKNLKAGDYIENPLDWDKRFGENKGKSLESQGKN